MLRGDGSVTRRRRAGTSLLVVHCAERTNSSSAARVGFVVSKAVGNSVVRHRVARRLRALVASRLSGIAASTDLVIRANPAAASASSEALAVALDKALSRTCPVAS